MASQIIKSQLDNRNPNKNKALIDEVLNDPNSLDEQYDNKSDDDAQETETPIKQEEEIKEDEIPNNEVKEEEPEEEILADDEEIDEDTGEAKKKTPVTTEKKNERTDSNELEERLAAQRRENIVIDARNRQLTDAFAQVGEVKEPTDEELQNAAATKGFDWEEMSNVEKALFKDNIVSQKKLSAVDVAMKGVKDIDEWAKGVDTFLDENERDQKDKSLIGREQDFRTFAMKSSHRGVPMDILVSAFLHDNKGTVKRTNGSLMLTKTGGQKVERKNNLADGDYVAALRKTNPKEYNRMARAGKIKIEV